MEEELSSTTTLSTETLKTNHQNNLNRPVKGVRVPRFKGVWKQKNGHCGVQLYGSKRIWLGTFHSETEAAMAYDSASIKLQRKDSHRNFPWNNITRQEPNFQKQFSTKAVFEMIRDGSYPLKFTEYLRKNPDCRNNKNIKVDANHGKGMISCTELFRKELTPSDVGKLNRLVIPKKCALRHFPAFSEDAKEKFGNGEMDILLLEFIDTSNKTWQFRYCYWKSSQSFVFTRGWNRFVKEKRLRVNDDVIFYMCERLDVKHEIETVFMIDIAYKECLINKGLIREKLEMDIEQENGDYGKKKDPDEGEIEVQIAQSKVKSIRIFGVEIFEPVAP